MLWVTYGLPGLDIGWTTYKIIDKSLLPFIDINPKYEKYNNLDDLKRDMPDIDSPTACYFAFNQSDIYHSFYRDQQDCVIWHFKPEVGVYINDDETQIVSDNLSEFLSRIELESRIWFKSIFHKVELSDDEKEYVEGIRKIKDSNI